MIKELISKIEEANQSYRIGNSLISDKEYDILLEKLKKIDPTNEIFVKVGHSMEGESRKTKLPINMASLSKVKSLEEIKSWARNKEISTDELVIITPKFDGLSLCVEESNNFAITRGNGEFGQRSNEHYTFIKNHLKLEDNPFKYTFGEVMMSKKNIF